LHNLTLPEDFSGVPQLPTIYRKVEFYGLNLSNGQIAHELSLDESDVYHMAAQLRDGIVKKPTVTLSNEVECDEAYVTAGHEGQPEVVKKQGRKGRRRRRKGPCGRGTLAEDEGTIGTK
jgi:hypothetical protein